MTRIVTALLFFPTLLFAKPVVHPEVKALDKAVEQAGGFARYQRLETLTCDFEETVYIGTGTAHVRGRRVFRLHDEGGFRAWEETQTDAGRRVTVVASSASWATLEGKPIPADPSGLAAELFWMTAPQRVHEAGNLLRILPQARFQGHLTDRFAVDGPPLFPGAEGLILCFHPETGRMEGALLGEEAVYFRSYDTAKGFIEIPNLRVHARGGTKTRAVHLSNVVVNGYVDDSLFRQPPQGAHP